MIPGVLCTAVVTDPDIIALFSQQQMERNAITELVQPEGPILHVSVLNKHSSFIITRSLFASLTKNVVSSQDIVILGMHLVRFPVKSKLQHDFGHAWVLDLCRISLGEFFKSAIKQNVVFHNVVFL